MSIDAIKTKCQQVWPTVEPYIAPSLIATGVAFIVNQVWGAVAAVSFMGIAAGAAYVFPNLVTQATSDDILMSTVRFVLIAVLPFFGTYGIVTSIGITAITSLSKNLRLYSIREKISEAEKTATGALKTLDDTQKKRQAMIKECNDMNESAKAYWNAVRPVEGIADALARFEQMAKENQASIQKTLDQLSSSDNQQEAASLVEQINQMNEFIKTLTTQYQNLALRVELAIKQISNSTVLGAVVL